jgi:hypothetical protein
MSQQNNGSSEMGLALALIGVGVFIFMAVIFAVAAFAALVLTIMCGFAWDNGLTIGKFTITREEARQFVARGVIGAFAVPLFALFAAILFNIHLREDVWIYLVIAGYAGGSIGVGMMLESQAQEAAAKAAAMPAPMIGPPPSNQKPSARAEEKPFTFASWDDEDDRS